MISNLGLGHSPEKVEYLFVGEAEDSQGSTPWYKMAEGDKIIPVHEDALTGIITNVAVIKKEPKGNYKATYKLNIYVQADRKYVIRAGVGTIFSRGFVLGMDNLVRQQGKEVLKSPITITVKQGQEGSKVIFCGLFDENKEKINFPWDGECQLNKEISILQENLDTVVQTKELMDDRDAYWQAYKTHNEKN